jgi:phosphatidylinositol 4-kinase
VFDGIEFYLPQLAHMIIHLEADWDDAILEQFALIFAQQSLHFALQLNWILQGAIEDYMPETTEGEFNPSYNPLFYSRCVKLLSNIERCVVYGTPRTHELQRLYEKGKISKQEYEIMEQADRRFNATQITSRNARHRDGSSAEGIAAFGGELLYKRKVRTACYKTKRWKTRWFTVDERMLYCFNADPRKGGKLKRAMPLEGAQIVAIDNTKYRNMFEVRNQHFEFRMRAKTEIQKDRWIEVLEEESVANALYPHSASFRRSKFNISLPQDNAEPKPSLARSQLMHDLTASQMTRYNFFKDERDFVRNVCDIAEDLRFKDRTERKLLAPRLMEKLSIPSCSYVPMCNSTDLWRRVSSVVAKDTRVFNTKERCPVIMYFVAKRGERLNHHRGGLEDVNLDVAEHLHLQYEVPDDASDKSMFKIGEGEDESENSDGPEIKSDDTVEVTPEGIVESWFQDEEKADSSTNAANIWIDDKGPEYKPEGESTTKGNKQVQRFMRENLVQLPNKIATRIQSSRKLGKMSVLDKSRLPMQSVPILENRTAEDDDIVSLDGQSVVSMAGGGSILNNGGVVFAVEEANGIDKESFDRAKEVVCGGETWAEKSGRMLTDAKKRPDPSDTGGTLTEIVCVMAKSNDDLRQEVFIMQMIHYYQSVFANASLPIWLKTYRILSTSKTTGLIEVLQDATSIDGLKKSPGFPAEGGLRAYFEQVYGAPTSQSFLAAQRNFMLSLVGYSLVSYLLGLKDRHNGNIMIDTHGRLIFIDFGFAFGMAPGHEFSMERAPFKLTLDMLAVMGGRNSECFNEFRRLFVAGLEAARSNAQVALGLVEIMMSKSNYPCFTGSRYGGGVSLKRFEKRLLLDVKDSHVPKRALKLIE